MAKSLATRVPAPKKSGDAQTDLIRAQQRDAFVEIIGLLESRPQFKLFRQSAGMPMPLGAGFAKILLAAQINRRSRPRLLRSLLWPVGVIFGYRTVVWLSS